MAQSTESATNPLPYHSSPESLQMLASFQTAKLLLRRKLRSEDGTQNTPFDAWLSGIRQSLQLPKTIGDEICKNVKRLNKELLSWEKRDCIRLTLDTVEDFQKRFVDLVVIGNDEKTVRKILDSGDFTDVEKYKMACYHCFENDIKKLWNSVSENRSVTAAKRDSPQMLLHYWNGIMMGKPVGENRSGALRLPWNFNLGWTAAKYFWSKLNSKERSTVLVDLVTMRDFSADQLVEFLPTLSHDEASRIWHIATITIFTKLSGKVEYFDYVLRIWAFYCNLASEKMVYHTLMHLSADASLVYARPLLSIKEKVQLSRVLGQLWHHTPSNVKEFVHSGRRVARIFDEMQCHSLSKVYDLLSLTSFSVRYRDTSFWLEILKGLDLTKRNQIWRKNWINLFLRADRSSIDRFMKLCFENDEDIEKFKRTKMSKEPFVYDDLEGEDDLDDEDTSEFEDEDSYLYA